jgi:tungstate transport system ATP-binding protein
MPLIETVNLCQKYGKRDILKNINLRVERGEVFALIGPTGAGKTTLLRLIDLIEFPAMGKIYFDGVDTAESARTRLELRRRMALVLQKPVVFNMSVYDNIAYGLKWRGVERSQIQEKVSQALEMVGLSAESNRNARTLSGGEAQRVAIARAITIEPEVLLLDEPTANLDPISVAKIEELITSIIRHYKTTIIMATHDMSQGQRLADKIGVLINGELLQTGGPHEVFTSPRSKEVAEFIGMENIINGVVVSSADKVVTIDIGGRFIQAISDCTIGDEVCACIRGEDIALDFPEIFSGAANSFTGEITKLQTKGLFIQVEMDCGFPVIALVTKRTAEELGLKEHQKVLATFKAGTVHIIKRN